MGIPGLQGQSPALSVLVDREAQRALTGRPVCPPAFHQLMLVEPRHSGEQFAISALWGLPAGGETGTKQVNKGIAEIAIRSINEKDKLDQK